MNFKDFRNDEYVGLKVFETELGRPLTKLEICIAKLSFHVGYDIGANDGYDDGRKDWEQPR